MLIIADKLRDLSFSSLMEVYYEGNLEKAREDWEDHPLPFAIQQAEQDFYLYLQDVFFKTPDVCYGVWAEGGRYISALRLEPYQDGFLLEALETNPQYRRMGYATKLVKAVLKEYPGRKIYAHIHKKNTASIKTHHACGFSKILDYAVYIDGSVNQRACTFLYE